METGTTSTAMIAIASITHRAKLESKILQWPVDSDPPELTFRLLRDDGRKVQCFFSDCDDRKGSTGCPICSSIR